MEPIVYGDYPKSMIDLVKERLPHFTEEEKKLVKGSFDFIGINYYTTRYGKNIPASQAEPICYHNDALAKSETESTLDTSLPLLLVVCAVCACFFLPLL